MLAVRASPTAPLVQDVVWVVPVATVRQPAAIVSRLARFDGVASLRHLGNGSGSGKGSGAETD